MKAGNIVLCFPLGKLWQLPFELMIDTISSSMQPFFRPDAWSLSVPVGQDWAVIPDP